AEVVAALDGRPAGRVGPRRRSRRPVLIAASVLVAAGAVAVALSRGGRGADGGTADAAPVSAPVVSPLPVPEVAPPPRAGVAKAFGATTGPKGVTGTWREPGFPASDDSPITHVSTADAEAFAAWLGKAEGRTYRLPTEAEWRWACRAGAATRYPFGDYPDRI